MRHPLLRRELVFTTVAVLAAPLVFASLLVLRGAVVDEMVKRDFVELIFWTGIFYYYAFIITFFVAIPTFAVFRYFGFIRWWSTSLAGGIIGLLVGSLLGGAQIEALAVFASAASLSAFAFWLIWRHGRPKVKG
jgi:hypothetical protein